MNGAATYAPPLFVFPRKRMIASLMNGVPGGSIAGVNKRGSGYIDGESYTSCVSISRLWRCHIYCVKDQLHPGIMRYDMALRGEAVCVERRSKEVTVNLRLLEMVPSRKHYTLVACNYVTYILRIHILYQ